MWLLFDYMVDKPVVSGKFFFGLFFVVVFSHFINLLIIYCIKIAWEFVQCSNLKLCVCVGPAWDVWGGFTKGQGGHQFHIPNDGEEVHHPYSLWFAHWGKLLSSTTLKNAQPQIHIVHTVHFLFPVLFMCVSYLWVFILCEPGGLETNLGKLTHGYL